MSYLRGFVNGLNKKSFLVLDTETTGLQAGEIVEIAICNHLGETLLDTLVKPKLPIPAEASRIHGIDDSRVVGAPTWPEIAPNILELLRGQNVVVYNAVYDRRMMHQSAERWDMKPIGWKEDASFYCAMEAYAEFYGDFNRYRDSYTWQPLSKAYRHATEKDHTGAHSALVDCLACLEVTKFLLNRAIEVLPPPTDVADMMGDV